MLLWFHEETWKLWRYRRISFPFKNDNIIMSGLKDTRIISDHIITDGRESLQFNQLRCSWTFSWLRSTLKSFVRLWVCLKSLYIIHFDLNFQTTTCFKACVAQSLNVVASKEPLVFLVDFTNNFKNLLGGDSHHSSSSFNKLCYKLLVSFQVISVDHRY